MPKKSPPKVQGTLFSFFSKKEPPNKPQKDEIPNKHQVHDFPKKPDSDETLHSVKPSDLGKKVPRPTKQVTQSPTRSASVTINQNTSSKWPIEPSQELVGKHVKVYWPDDQAWYLGKVIEFSREDGKHTIHYTDGDKERVTLADEKFELATNEDVAGCGGRAAKTRSKVIQEDEEEDEWIEEELDDGSADGSSNEGVSDGDEVMTDGNRSQGSEAPVTPRRREASSNKQKRAEHLASSYSTSGLGAKRLKKASDQSHFTITDTESPVNSARRPAADVSAMSGPVRTPTSQSSTKSRHSVVSLDKATSPAPVQTPRSVPLPEGVLDTGRHKHHGLSWLYKDRTDKNRRKPDDPQYNPRTLYVPPSFLKEESPAMRQWWAFKSENMDTVLFFKVGKFYELFHQDADVGMQELDLIYMKGEKAHSGFPEISYGKYSDILVSKGYLVARVEQAENPEMLRLRNASKGKHALKDKVVKRELCSILSRGTRTYCFLDDVSSAPDGSPRSVNMILSIQEKVLLTPEGTNETEEGAADGDGPPPAVCEYGVCMVDSTTATFSLGQFADDRARSRLRTLLAQQIPAEILMEKDNLSETTIHMMKCMAPSASYFVLRKGEEFWDARRTIRELHNGRYFKATSMDGQNYPDPSSNEGDTTHWPKILRAAVDGGKDCAMALSSLGGATWHIRRALIDHDLLSMKRFGAYIPSDHQNGAGNPLTGAATTPCAAEGTQEADFLPSASSLPGSSNGLTTQSHMVLDGVSLSNLEVLRNSCDGGEKGSLWGFVNRCSTAFGKRMLKEWVMKPLLIPRAMNARLDAVAELSVALSPEADATRALLEKLPDVERLLSRVHSMASKHRSSEHPESRAIMYEDTKYSIRKVNDFLSVLDGLEAADGIPAIYAAASVDSALLRKCVLPVADGGQFPNMTSAISFFRNAFDAAPAKREGVIKPKPGVDPLFDQAKESIRSIEFDLNKHLQEQRQRLRCSEIAYWGSAKDKYQLEVPEAQLSKNGQPSDYELKTKKKGWKRFWTPFIKEKLVELADAEQQLGDAQRDQMRRMFAKFDEHRDLWASAVRCLAHLDALLSLAEVSSQPGFLRPIFYEGAATSSFIRLKNARHPCLTQTYQGGEYIPNDATLGSTPQDMRDDTPASPNMLLLTGPNMGGKSTLLRQTCLVAILAQVGCFVPADEAHMTPFDRIFTRVGASDRILAGQSTFFVELSETATILHHATSRSLVILDELGRGTSTFDGTAIAHAVAHFLVKRAKCLAMFATHYHSLVEEWGQHSEVALGHMSCLVDDSEGEQRVTFLYKLAPGPCPKSFGINVARLAQLPNAVISAAQVKSEEFQSALSCQNTAVAGDDKGRLALALLALLGGEDTEAERAWAGEQLRGIWSEARRK